VSLEVRQLGRFQVLRDDVPIRAEAWSRQKTLAIAKVLLSRRGYVFHLDQLTEAVFPDSDPSKAARNVRARVVELRRTLEPELARPADSQFVLTAGTGYVFSREAPCWVDTEAFLGFLDLAHAAADAGAMQEAIDRYREACSLYRGDYLEEDVYEEWTIRARQEYREQFVLANLRRAGCHAGLGQYQQAIDCSRRALDKDRYREEAYRQLMHCFTSLSEPGKAIQAYAECVKAQAELGATPSQEMEMLCREIKQGKLAQGESARPHRQAGRTHVASSARGSGRRPVPQRRHLTVLACLLTSPSPEAKQESEFTASSTRDCLETCLPIITRHGGTVVRDHQGQLVAFFGYPSTYEDNAARASHTGLEIIRAAKRLDCRQLQGECPRVAVQIGIGTGWAREGDLCEEYQQGCEPNCGVSKAAWGLAGGAAPNTILVDQATCRIIEDLFICHPAQPRRAVEEDWSVGCVRLVSTNGAATRLEHAVLSGLTPLVGRQPEMTLLLHHWERARAGAGRAVALAGEAGVGKSRTILEFERKLADQLYVGLWCRGSPYHKDTPLYPVTTLLERLLHFSQDDAGETKERKLLAAILGTPLDAQETLSLVAPFLSVPRAGMEGRGTLAPESRRKRLLHALGLLLTDAASRIPVLLIAEDVHWMDSSTLELLELVINQASSTKLLVLCTYRPQEFSPQWLGKPQVVPVRLASLEADETEAMASMVAGKPLPRKIVEEIGRKTGGVPLLVEEMTQVIVSSGLVEQRGDRFELASPTSALSIPASLHDWLRSRLDQAGVRSSIGQLGAVIGREFEYELLDAIRPQSTVDLDAELRKLVDAGLLFQRGFPPHSSYCFKHDLIREAAYDSLPANERATLHKKVAEQLERTYPDLVEQHPEILAHHLSEAGDAEQAIPYWRLAGCAAAERSANWEAMSHFRKGLGLIQGMPDGPERFSLELDFQLSLGGPLLSLKGYAAPELEAAFGRAWQIVEQMGEAPQQIPTLFFLCQHNMARAQHVRNKELAERAFRIASEVEDNQVKAQAHFGMGVADFFIGAFRAARDHLDQALVLYSARDATEAIPFYGLDHGVLMYAYAGFVRRLLGETTAAGRLMRRAVELSDQRQHPNSSAMAVVFNGWLHVLNRDAVGVRDTATRLYELADKHGFELPRTTAAQFEGWVLIVDGKQGAGIRKLNQVLDAWERMGSRFYSSPVLGWLADAYKLNDEPKRALETIDRAIAFADETEERFYEAELLRIRGDILWHSGKDVEKAVQSYSKARDVARKQEARSWELRAATSLARVLDKLGQRSQAVKSLAAACNAFGKESHFPDLDEARSLLLDLRKPPK